MTVGWDGRVRGGAKQFGDAAAARTHTAGGGGEGRGWRAWLGREKGVGAGATGPKAR